MYRMYIIIFMVLGALENVLQLKSESRLKKVGVWNSAKYECWHFPACTDTNRERRTPGQPTGVLQGGMGVRRERMGGGREQGKAAGVPG